MTKRKLIIFDNPDKMGWQEKSKVDEPWYIPHDGSATLFVGKTSCGKTSALLNQVLAHAKSKKPFDEVKIIHYLGSGTSEYDILIENGAEIYDQMPNLLKTCSCETTDDDDCNCPYDNEQRNKKKLLILEDLNFNLPKKQLQRLERLFGVIGSHNGWSIYLTVQTIGSLHSPHLKKLIKSIYVWSIDYESLRQISSRYNVPLKYLTFFFKNLCEDQQHDFLLIRPDIPMGKGRYLKNMYEIMDDNLQKFSQ